MWVIHSGAEEEIPKVVEVLDIGGDTR